MTSQSGPSLAFYLDQTGKTADALRFLQIFTARQSCGMDTRLLLADLFLKSGRNTEAISIYRQPASVRDLPPEQRTFIERRMSALQAR